MASRVITESRSIEINDPNYLHKCSKCGKLKPNTEYCRNKNIGKQNLKGRRYVSQCKSCREVYRKKYISKEVKRGYQIKQTRKYRMNIIYWSSIGNSKRRKLEHSITIDDLYEVFEKQKGLCYYTNEPMFLDTREEKDNENSVSIDRVDSSKGYIKENIVLCRWIVNRMKNDLGFEQFLDIVSKICKNFTGDVNS